MFANQEKDAIFLKLESLGHFPYVSVFLPKVLTYLSLIRRTRIASHVPSSVFDVRDFSLNDWSFPWTS